jgi:branched-chain amino acid transport system ATP-binding protein
VRGISLSFKGVRAITDLSFDVRAGEICALIGPNGAGKSSLLNILNGVYRADAGELVFDGAGLPACTAGGGPPRHRPHLPEQRAVQEDERARQHLTGLSRHAQHLYRAGAGPAAGPARSRGFRQQAEGVLEFLELQA